MNTRMICQVVEWERRLEIENEKLNNHLPEKRNYFELGIALSQKVYQSIHSRFFRFDQNSHISIHSSEPI